MLTHYKLKSSTRPGPPVKREPKVYRTRAKLWLYSGAAASWHFITIPVKLSREIKNEFGAMAGGWGSIRVEARIGETAWKTSIFPDKKRGAYILPVKSQVRKEESLKAGQSINLLLSI